MNIAIDGNQVETTHICIEREPFNTSATHEWDSDIREDIDKDTR